MRKLWLWLRDVVWTSVLTIVLIAGSITLVIIGEYELAYVLGLSGIAVAVLSGRQ